MGVSRDMRLTGSRVYLRAPYRSDFRNWKAVREASRDHLMPWEPEWHPNAHTRSHWRERLRILKRAWNEDRGYSFFLFAKADDALLGGLALTNVRRGPAQSAMLGYWLGVEGLGQGYMQEAVPLICHWGMTELKLARIEAGIVPENHRSRQVLERSGFVEEGLCRSYLEISGKRRDHILFSCISREQLPSQ